MLGWANLKPQIWAWVVGELLSQPALLFLPSQAITTRASSPALPWIAQPMLQLARDRASSPHFHASKASSTVKCGACSPALVTSGPALPPAVGGQGQGIVCVVCAFVCPPPHFSFSYDCMALLILPHLYSFFGPFLLKNKSARKE